MRCAIYARVSTSEKGQDPENQLAQMRDFAARMNWQITHEYVDHLSGKSGDRAQFEQLFADASRRRFDCVLFWALDRFSREGALATLQYLERLSSYGIAYRSFTEQYLDSAGIFKDAIIGILATLAKQERVRMSERVKAGLDRARAKGKQIGRRSVVDPARAREAFAAHKSLRKAAKKLGVSHEALRSALGA